jgi:preprotein translocase subunit SecE
MSLINYLKETKSELKHVSWPTKSQSVWFTIVVIAISLFTAFFLGFFDFIFSKGLEIFIK